MRKARLDQIATIEDLAHGAVGPAHPLLPIFGDPSQPDEAFK